MIWDISFALLEHDAYDEKLVRIVNNDLAESTCLPTRTLVRSTCCGCMRMTLM